MRTINDWRVITPTISKYQKFLLTTALYKSVRSNSNRYKKCINKPHNYKFLVGSWNTVEDVQVLVPTLWREQS